jgi:transposase
MAGSTSFQLYLAAAASSPISCRSRGSALASLNSDQEAQGRLAALPTRFGEPRGEVMLEPAAVAAMLRLKELGWGTKRIARELGASRGTVKRYLAAGGWRPFKSPARQKRLDGLEDWLKERFRRHRGNADVVRQELCAEKGLRVSLRTVERAVAPLRRELEVEARASVRFETAPGRQLQIDFGERLVEIDEVKVTVFLFVATLGYSRRLHTRAFEHERQESWFEGLESAFLAFGGVPEEVLIDNPRALVAAHDAVTRTVAFNAKFLAFARHWGFTPRACAPYRARTKGKIESGVGYVKKNAIAGRSFESWGAFEAHLAAWERGVANVRAQHHRRGADGAVRTRRGTAA